MIVTDTRAIAPWIMQRAECSIASDATTIGWVNSEGILTAATMYEHWTGPTVTATIAIEPGTVVAKEFIAAIFAYPFDQLKCKQILAFVAEENVASIAFLERCGFKVTATVPDVFEGDEAMRIYCLKREDCRFLEDQNG